MSITYTDRIGSPRLTSGATNQYARDLLVSATAGETVFQVRDFLASDLPATVDGLGNRQIEINRYSDGETDDVGVHERWLAKVTWGAVRASWSGNPPVGSPLRASFDTTGGTVRVFQSKETLEGVGRDGAPIPDFKGAIGVTRNGVEGVDIVQPRMRRVFTKTIADAAITPEYEGTLFALTGKVNNASFLNFAAGELLFLGARGEQQETGDWTVGFEFIANPNRADVQIGDLETIDDVGGHNVLWSYYQEEVDSTAEIVVTRPIYAYVERVYDAGDFTALGLT